MSREPLLKPTAITELRPTQISVGMREVADKRAHWRDESAQKESEYLGRHMIPVVLGPKGRPYLIDHHHLALALHLEGEKHVLTTVVSDLSRLDREAFWIYLDSRGWMHPFDAKGRRRSYEDLPNSISDMVDDPYRSLAGALRRAGGFAKDTTPFSEFLWADFLRRRIKPAAIKRDFDKALDRAIAEAKTQAADYLPGWSGPSDD
ncbi:chromosome partitioning protein ParB [Bosea caraganae]|uniref:Chromosome partitioning protein ParB n=1 Tax=Bosea caraganae TaxID=2763117 RepID=A0A370L3V4_9HYPH|nr:ParB-like protein [Bosea caraganae]RDJ23028.1 chromosome partitioning protein ParB [Bosea caraganae]RDJ28808.1 chromosome partitioning protein ParB [Bosea caraganae]